MATNWVVQNFCLLQETGGNILTEDSNYVALQEFDSTTWSEQTDAGSG